MKLKRIGLTRIATPKFMQLNTELKNTIIANPKVYEKVKKYFDDKFLPAYENMQEAFKRAEKSDYTDDIKDANALRGETYIGLFELVRALIRHPDNKTSSAAKKVKNLLERYGNFTQTSIDGQTAYIDDLLREFANRYEEEAKTLNLTPFITTLTERNNNFSALMNERYVETAKQSKITVVDARKVLQEVFTILCNLIDSIWVMDEDADIAAFINRFNVVLDRFGIGSGGTETVLLPEMPDDDDGSGDNNGDDDDNLEEKYPDAKEWYDDAPFQGVENGDVYYILVDGKKVFYELVDKNYFFDSPDSAKGANGWEKLE